MRLYNASELSLENKLPLKLHPHPDKTDIRHLKSNMDGPESKWTVQTTETGRPCIKLDCQKDSKWTVLRAKTGRSKRMELDGLKR